MGGSLRFTSVQRLAGIAAPRDFQQSMFGTQSKTIWQQRSQETKGADYSDPNTSIEPLNKPSIAYRNSYVACELLELIHGGLNCTKGTPSKMPDYPCSYHDYKNT